MTNNHPGSPTHPLRTGAPLPDDKMMSIERVDPQDVTEEMARARVELLYALARHRKAWSAFDSYAASRDAKEGKPGALASIDSDPTWSQRTNDVKWWRDEITCQANAILALQTMVPVSRETRELVRDSIPTATIFGWNLDGSQPPSERQYRTACSWRDQIENEGRLVEVAAANAVERLIAVYEQEHPVKAVRLSETVRQIVLAWDENVPPTREQYQAALTWHHYASGQLPMDGGKVQRLLEAYTR